MVQILRQPGLGELLGQGIGSGLSSGLSALANIRLQELMQQRQQQQIAPALKALGLQGYESLPVPLLQTILKNRAKESETTRFAQALNLFQGQGEQETEITPAMQAVMQPDQIQQPQAEQSGLNLQNLLKSSGLQGLINPEAIQALGGPQALLKQPQKPQEPIQPPSEILQKKPIPQMRDIIPTDITRIAKLTRLSPVQYKELNQIAQENQKTKLASRKQEFLEAKEQRRTEREQELAGLEKHKFSKPEIKAARDAATAAKRSLHDLDRMEELQKEGKLDTPGYAEFLKRSGLDIPALMSPGSEEFNKIAANFIGGAKQAVGGRVTNFELEQFLKTIPNLSQSPEGRNRVIANLKRISRANVEYYNTVKEILTKNKNVPPLDLFERVDDKLEKKMDMIALQFKDDLLKPVPAGQHKLITALQSIGGSLLGVPGSILGAAGKLLGGSAGGAGGAEIAGLAAL